MVVTGEAGVRMKAMRRTALRPTVPMTVQETESQRAGRARDSPMDERHGDGGRALDKNRERLKELEREIKVVPKKERLKLVRKKEKILRYSKKKKSGTEHSRTRKR